MAVLKVQNLIKTYGSFCAVDDVSFEVRKGEVFGLLGPNGAGKTSLISTIVSLEEAKSGTITINGKDITKNIKETKSIIGFVPQEIISHGYFNIDEILQFQAGYYGIMNSRGKIMKVLKELDLWEHRHKKVRILSGGMKRRLMLAKALLHNPKLLLLDEPTAGVDVQLRYSIWQYIRELTKQGVAILFTTHYLEEAEVLCDRVGIIHNGKIQKQSETKQLIKQLTSRHLTITVKNKITCSHPNLINQSENTFEFRVPYSKQIGQILSELNWKNENILDLKVREGNLEDAMKYILTSNDTKDTVTPDEINTHHPE